MVKTGSERAPPPEASTGSAADFVPTRPTLPKLRVAAAGCRGCHLWLVGSQTVFGEGPRSAEVMLVGEQPGEQEDREGHPFVGPSGRLLSAALEAAGIDRGAVYVTNAVKHFKFVLKEGGRRRIGQKPNDTEIRACLPWLREEIRLVKPRVIVALGATAAQALLGKQVRVLRDRGKPLTSDWAEAVFTTVHPASVLRAPDAGRGEARQEFFDDLRQVARYLARGKTATARRHDRTAERKGPAET